MSSSSPNRIREWRNRRRLSLADLGEIVGLSRSELSKLESGNRRVRADHLVVLSKALKVTPDELMDKDVVREMLGEIPATTNAQDTTIPTAHAKRNNGKIYIHFQQKSPPVEAHPQLAMVPDAYAFYMPDTSMEPRIPVGALLFVNPLLPPRAGDIAVITTNSEPPTLAIIERLDQGGLQAVLQGNILLIKLDDQAITSTHRVVGMMFP